MILLALDTSIEACSVAVWTDGRTLAARSEPMERGHQERLAPLVAEAMTEAGLAFSALDRIAVTLGPGSFTGVRVGLAFAKSMALALGVPCTGVGTLAALLASRPEMAAAPMAAAALDARRGRVHLQLFENASPLGDAEILAIDAAQARLAAAGSGAEPPLVGSGAVLLRPHASPGRSFVDPVALAAFAARQPVTQSMPAPLYLRAPDARTIAERLAERAAAAPA